MRNRSYFYVSYSSLDAKDNPHFKEFYKDLVGQVTRSSGFTEILLELYFNFYDRESVESAGVWEPRIAEALNTCSAFVCLYSQNYFQSEYCGKEFEAFHSRLRAYSASKMNELGAPQSPQIVLPVIWDSPSRIWNALPVPFRVPYIQLAHPSLGAAYAENGLSYLMETGRKGDYGYFLTEFAERIIRAVETVDLPPLPVFPPLTAVPSAFHPSPVAAHTPPLPAVAPPAQPPGARKVPAAAPTPPAAGERLRVFLCHASTDKPAVRELYGRLKADGFAPWLDEEDLLGGQVWEEEIEEVLRSTHIVLVCLSNNSINKAGYIQREIREVLNLAEEQPEGEIFLIPLKLEECDIPRRLGRWQWINFFREDGYDRLLRSLRARAAKLGIVPA